MTRCYSKVEFKLNSFLVARTFETKIWFFFKIQSNTRSLLQFKKNLKCITITISFYIIEVSLKIRKKNFLEK